ncbi:MAG: hypothetical protein R3B82_00545 [Sandaracinaceae bacterium]
MASTEPRSAAPPRGEEREPAYEGSPGRTRLRSVHVTLASGFVRLVQVYDVVNVATDPHLKDPALSGALHRFETGESLAIPFVYHDPGARKLALVVPTELRHEELALRAKLLTTLDEDRESPVPAYVAEAKTVVGVQALAAYLEAKNTHVALAELEQEKVALGQREGMLGRREAAIAQRESALAQHEQDMKIQADALGQREERLHQRAERVTRREDELRTLSEELEAARADIRMQEQELEARFEMLHEREGELIKRAESGPTPIAQLADPADVAPVVEPPAPEPIAAVSIEAAAPIAAVAPVAVAAVEPAREVGDDDVVQLVDDEVEDMSEVIEDVEELEEIEDLEPLETNPAASLAASVAASPVPTSLSSAVEMVVESLRAEEVQVIGEEEVEELEEVVPLEDVTGIVANPLTSSDELPAVKTTVAMPAPEPEPQGPVPSVPPPPPFAGLRAGEAIARLTPEGVRIDARLVDGKDDAFAEDPEALVQLAVVDDVRRRSTVAERTDRARGPSAPVDPRSEEAGAARSGSAASVACASRCTARTGAALRHRRGRGPGRELERAAGPRPRREDAHRLAVGRVLDGGGSRAREPPPIHAKDHPFVPPSELAPAFADAAAAKKALSALEAWASHDKMDRAPSASASRRTTSMAP